jgi:hypothetical protein
MSNKNRNRGGQGGHRQGQQDQDRRPQRPPQGRGPQHHQNQQHGGGRSGFERVEKRPSRLVFFSDDVTEEALNVVTRMDGRIRSMQERRVPIPVRRDLKEKFQAAVTAFSNAVSQLVPEANGRRQPGGRTGGQNRPQANGQQRKQQQASNKNQSGQNKNQPQQQKPAAAPAQPTAAAPAQQTPAGPAGTDGAQQAGEVLVLDPSKANGTGGDDAGAKKDEKKSPKTRARRAAHA